MRNVGGIVAGTAMNCERLAADGATSQDGGVDGFKFVDPRDYISRVRGKLLSFARR